MRALDDRTAVVTGGSRGIGLAIVRSLAAHGARVVLLARHPPAGRDAPQWLGAPPTMIACDLSHAADVERALREIERSVGVPDLLVNNAGAFALGAIGEMPPSEVERMIAVNVLAPYRLLHTLVPAMRSRGRGHVVTIGSVADRHAYPENAGYAAGKYGLRAMHEVLRQELHGSGVRVSLVSPGPVDTPLWDPIQPETRPGFTPRARMLRPEAVADAVLWVATRASEVNVDELRLSHA